MQYAFFIFFAYTFVLVFLFVQWIIPWLRWRKYLLNQKDLSPNE